MRTHTRAALLCVAAALTLTACAAGKGGGGATDGAAAAPGKDDKLTLTVWSNYSDREYEEVTKALKTFNKKFPNIEIKHEGSQDDDKITAGIRSGNTPDVALSFTTDNIGQFCSSGAFQALKPYIDRDKVDLNQISPAVREYTEYKGNRCAMPMLTDVYAMYYNTDMMSAAGVSAAPKTMDELFEAAKKLTKKNAAGEIEVAGYLPTMGFYANRPTILAPSYGAEWEKDGKSALATSPGFAEMMKFQKKLVDFYGYDALERFRAGLGQEYSADHAFHQGKIAIMMDGEYRTAFLKAQAPQIKFGTAPFPTLKPGRLRHRLHHRHDHGHSQGRQEPRRRVGADQAPVVRQRHHRRPGQRHQERAEHQGRDGGPAPAGGRRSSRRSSTWPRATSSRATRSPRSATRTSRRSRTSRSPTSPARSPTCWPA